MFITPVCWFLSSRGIASSDACFSTFMNTVAGSCWNDLPIRRIACWGSADDWGLVQATCLPWQPVGDEKDAS